MVLMCCVNVNDTPRNCRLRTEPVASVPDATPHARARANDVRYDE